MADKEENLISTENADAVSVADVFINQIIVQLHEKALEQIKDTNYTVQNSAIEGEGKNAKFFGAGQHMIAAIPQEKGNKIPIKVALSMLKTYVQWFVGPDLKTSIEEKDLVALGADDTSKSDDKKDKSDVNDSAIYVPTFSQYLLLEDGENTEEDPEVTAQKADAEKTKKDKNSKDEKDAKKDAESTSAPGYYITYSMEIEGQKEHPLADALKKFGTNILDGFGIKLGNWRTGASGEAHTIGDLKNALDEVFGNIDPDKLQSDYQKNLQQDFKSTHAQAAIFDTKTIINMLKGQISGSDRSKIKSAEYALCTRVSKNDKSYELFNQKKIANTITKSIQGLYKKFKNKITNKDVILVNNYDDNEKNKNDSKFIKKKEVSDSIIANANNIILEEDGKDDKTSKNDKDKQKIAYEPIKQADAEKILQGIAKTKLKDNYSDARVRDVKAIIDILKKAKVTDAEIISKLNSEIEKYPNAYLIKTTEKDNSKQQVNASQHTKFLLNKLFESISKSNLIDTVKGTFIALIDTLAKKQKRNSSEELTKPDDIKGYSPDVESPKKESKEINYRILKLCFEDLDETLVETLISEGHADEWKEVQAEIERVGLKNFTEKIQDVRAAYDKEIDNIKKNNPDDKYVQNKQFGKAYKRFFMQSDAAEKFKSIDTAKKAFIEAFNSSAQGNDVDRNAKTSDERYEMQAILKALKTLPDDPDKKDNEKNDDKIEITFMDIEDPTKLEKADDLTDTDKEQYKPIGDPLKIVPGEDVKIPDVENKGKWEFMGFEPDPENMDQSGKTYAMYEKNGPDVVTITFYDFDPEKDKRIEEPLDKVEIEKGTAINASDEAQEKIAELNKKLEDGKKKGFTYKGWDPSVSTKVEEDTDVVAKYVKDDDKDKEFTVIFQYPPDPSDANKVEQIEGDLGEQKVKAGKAAKEPEKPEIEGWNFKKWSESFDNVTDDLMIVAEYTKKINIIPKVPKDPEKPDDTEPFGNPIPYDPTKPIKEQLPELPKKDGWQADGWDPDPDTIKDPTEDIEITGKYKKDDKDPKKDITITFKEPVTPDKPDKLVILGDPIKYDPKKRIKPTESPTDFTKDGYEFEKWDPDPASIENPTEDIDIIAKYKKIEAGTITTYWILQDINHFLDGQNNANNDEKTKDKNELKTNGTGLDFYIVPMKGLKYKDEDLARNQKK